MVLESDCLAVCQAWNRDDDRSVGCNIFREMRTYLPFFQGFEFRWTGREANGVAHRCAKEALVVETSSISFSVIPEFLIDVVQSDLFRQDE